MHPKYRLYPSYVKIGMLLELFIHIIINRSVQIDEMYIWEKFVYVFYIQ